MEKLYLVDAYALIYKFYYAFKSNPMRNSKGVNTSAIYGFTKFINDIIIKRAPHYMGVAFDPRGGNFRHNLYPQYKANRSDTPEDIITSIPYIKSILEAMKIPILEVAGYEADDVIGTISSKAACKYFEVYMVTPDKDYGQLIQDCVYMYKPGKKGSEVEIIGKELLEARYGLSNPSHIIDMLAIWGDASDNIPGVPGIGEKGAVALINRFGTVENILENIDLLQGKQKENIINNKEQLLLSKKLVTIDINVPIAFNPDELRMERPDFESLRKIYIELGFHSLLKDVDAFREEVSISDSVELFTEGLFAFDDNGKKNLVEKKMDVLQELSLFDEQTNLINSIENTPHEYILVESKEGIEKLIHLLLSSKEFCFDTETTSLSTVSASLVGISFAVTQYKAYYVPINSKDRDAAMETLSLFRDVFENKDIAKIGQNLKFDISMLMQYGIEVNGVLYDTMIMHYLIDSDERHSMDYLSEKYLNYSPVAISELIGGKSASQKNMADVDISIIKEYAAEDADVTLQLKHILYKELKANDLDVLYHTVEEPLIKVLASMEMAGVKIDTKALKEFEQEMNAELGILAYKIIDMGGVESLNINSSKQIGQLLFETLKIESKPKLTKTKQYRTDEEYLLFLKDKHPIIELILEYRGIKKLLSTYIEALPALINPKTGRIHTTYNQCVTSTGRLSSTNPNLQNIPIRDERGKRMRAAFVASDSNHILLSADYSQIELRIMADLSGDEALIDAFFNGEDIHTATAAKIFNIPMEDVTSDQRRAAKTANFGIIYGISAFGLAGRLDISRGDAKKLIDGYFASYPKVKEYMETSIAKAREKGYIETVMHRKKALKDINSSNQIVRGYAERNAINAPIQGSAADIIKMAMATIYNKLKEMSLQSRMILQVHDELVVELHKDELHTVKEIVIQAMQEAYRLKVPLIAECGYGINWLQAH